MRQVPGGERHLEPIRQLVHKNSIPFENRRFHRAGRHVVPIRNRRAEGREDQDEDQDRPDLASPVVDDLASGVRGHEVSLEAFGVIVAAESHSCRIGGPKMLKWCEGM